MFDFNASELAGPFFNNLNNGTIFTFNETIFKNKFLKDIIKSKQLCIIDDFEKFFHIINAIDSFDLISISSMLVPKYNTLEIEFSAYTDYCILYIAPKNIDAFNYEKMKLVWIDSYDDIINKYKKQTNNIEIKNIPGLFSIVKDLHSLNKIIYKYKKKHNVV